MELMLSFTLIISTAILYQVELNKLRRKIDSINNSLEETHEELNFYKKELNNCEGFEVDKQDVIELRIDYLHEKLNRVQNYKNNNN